MACIQGGDLRQLSDAAAKAPSDLKRELLDRLKKVHDGLIKEEKYVSSQSVMDAMRWIGLARVGEYDPVTNSWRLLRERWSEEPRQEELRQWENR